MEMNWLKEMALPRWCTGLALGDYMQEGAQLSTRDGRKVGNAVVVNVEYIFSVDKAYVCAFILTDAGNALMLDEAELASLFHPPVFLMDPATSPGWKVMYYDK